MAFHSNGQLFELIYIYNSSYTYFWSIEWYVTKPSGVDAHLMWTFSVFLTTRKKNQHIVRDSSKSRLRSKLYLVNSFGMMGMLLVHAKE